jgi:hypothetical protein
MSFGGILAVFRVRVVGNSVYLAGETTAGRYRGEGDVLYRNQELHEQRSVPWSIGVVDYWDLLAGVLLTAVGAYNLWVSRSAHFEANPVTAGLSRLLSGVGRARFITLVAGVFCVILGVVNIIFGVTGMQ